MILVSNFTYDNIPIRDGGQRLIIRLQDINKEDNYFEIKKLKLSKYTDGFNYSQPRVVTKHEQTVIITTWKDSETGAILV